MRIRISSLGNDVGGVSPGEGRKTVFVRGALPGELVECIAVKESGSFIRADLLEVLEPSPDRVSPACAHFGECGGCSLQHLVYPQQLEWKRRWVIKALERAGVDPCVVAPVAPSPALYGCRNRVSFDMTPGGPGLHRQRGDPMPVDRCLLLNSRGDQVYRLLRGNRLTGCRRISVRASDITGLAMVEFSGMPDTGIPELGAGVTAAWKEDGEWLAASPESVLTEKLHGLAFRVGPGAFFQVNTACAEILVHRVLGLAGGKDSILDLYGGCGTFALPAASFGARVTSVEMDPASSASGRASAELNGVRGVEFRSGRARHFLLDCVRSGRTWDSVIVDPPRAGLGVRVARLLRRVNTPQIVYVSCNPFSLARDLEIICERDWRVAGLHPVDMFPQTDHIESVTVLRKVTGLGRPEELMKPREDGRGGRQ